MHVQVPVCFFVPELTESLLLAAWSHCVLPEAFSLLCKLAQRGEREGEKEGGKEGREGEEGREGTKSSISKGTYCRLYSQIRTYMYVQCIDP